MSALNYLPLLAIGVLLGVIFLASFSGSLDRFISKIALSVFGRYLTIRGPRPRREQLLQAAYIGTPYRVYESNTLLYSTITALSGSVLGVYIASATLLFVSGLPTGAFVGPSPIPSGLVAQLQSVPELSPAELFSLLLISSGTVGVLIGLATYRLRWLIPELQAGARRRRIELSMPRMIALMYALSRGGLGSHGSCASSTAIRPCTANRRGRWPSPGRPSTSSAWIPSARSATSPTGRRATSSAYSPRT